MVRLTAPINGFGVGLYGWLRDPGLPIGHLKLYFVTALWLPIIPLRAYAVTPSGNGFRFHYSMTLWGAARVFGCRVVPFYITALLEGAIWLVLFVSVIVGVMFGLRWMSDQFCCYDFAR